MEESSKKAFRLSVALHSVFFLMLIIAAVVEAFDEPPEPDHVFELVTTADAAPPAPTPPTPQQPEPEEFNLNTIPEPAPPLDRLPDPPPPPPAPREVDRPATPTPPTPPKPEPPKPEPPKPAEPEPKTMSAKDFFDKFGKPKVNRPAPQQPRNPVTVREIDSREILNDLNSSVANSSERSQVREMTATEQAALQRYIAKLKAQLNQVWEKPGSLAGRDLKAMVVFKVSASGQISGVRVVSSSGVALFDASIKTAFSRSGNMGAPPDGRAHEWKLAFEMLR